MGAEEGEDMICIQCAAEGKTPDSLIEKCVHCGEHVCADKHVARYVSKRPVCEVCIEWVCQECEAYVDYINRQRDGRLLCRNCVQRPAELKAWRTRYEDDAA